MKKVLFFCCLFVSTILSAQAPQGINYQAVYRDANGVAVEKSLNVQCIIWDNFIQGTKLYAENHSPSTNKAGLFTLVIGTGSPTFKSFASIDWEKNQKWCEIIVNGTQLGAFQFQSVPYALHAANAVSLPAGTILSFAGEDVPDGYLACDGLEYNKTAYPDLAKALGTAWGKPTNTSTFRVPNLRGRLYKISIKSTADF